MPEAYLRWVSFIDESTRQRCLGKRMEGPPRLLAALGLDRRLEPLRPRPGPEPPDLSGRRSPGQGRPDEHGARLEVRSPFLDAELAAYAIQLPPGLKARGLSLKRVLKHALSDDLPPEILRRRKRGFGVPLDRWFREDLKCYVDQMLGADDARVRSHLRGEAIDALLAEHATGGAIVAGRCGRS